MARLPRQSGSVLLPLLQLLPAAGMWQQWRLCSISALTEGVQGLKRQIGATKQR
jgi:hypothetical protein